LRAADGHALDWSSKRDWPNGGFHGAGDWIVEMETIGDWQLVIKPMIGPSGGGGRWF